MPRRRFRDVITGLFTTSADAAARPANTVGETVRPNPARTLYTSTPEGKVREMTFGEVEQHDRDMAAHLVNVAGQPMTAAEYHDRLMASPEVVGTDPAVADRLLDTIGAPEAYVEEMAALSGGTAPVIGGQVDEVVGLSFEIIIRDGEERTVNWISPLDEPTRVSRGQMPAFAVMLRQAIKGGNVIVGATYEEVRDAKQADALRYYERARIAYVSYLDDLAESPNHDALEAVPLVETYTDDGVEIVVERNLFGLHGPTPPALKVVYRKRGARDFVSRAEARANPAAHVALVVLARN